MHPRVPRTAFFVVVIVLLAGLLAGCGGGDQSEGGSQEGGSEGQNGGSTQQNGGSRNDGSGESQQVRIALGTIGSVMPDDNRFTLEPSTEEQGEQPITFRVRPSTQITVAGEEAELGDLEEGAQANVNYVAMDGKNRARAVEVLGE